MDSLDFSVVVPMYNAENTIEKCLRSIICQNFTNFELIIIDDGSTDNSRRICEKLCENRKQIRIFKQKNQGVSSARNKGISHARGKWLVFVDADDELSPNCLKVLRGNFLDTDVIVVADNLLKTERIELNDKKREAIIYEFLNISKSKTISGSVCSKSYRRQLIEENGILFNENLINGEDTLFNISIFLNARVVSCVKEAIYHYYINPHSVTHSFQKGIINTDMYFLVKLEQIGNDYRFHDFDKIYAKVVLNGLWICLNLCISHVDNKISFSKRKRALRELVNIQPYQKYIAMTELHKDFGIKQKMFAFFLRLGMYDFVVVAFLIKSRLQRKKLLNRSRHTVLL